MSATHCGRMDRHDAHEWIYRVPGTASTPIWPLVVDCPGVVTIEGGSLDTHDCGARVHPAEIRDCCSRCTGTLCPNCEPCRRVS